MGVKWEEHRLRVFENRVLRRIFGSRRDKVTGGCKKLHNEELHNMYFLPCMIRIVYCYVREVNTSTVYCENHVTHK
jgi:hypothetical protein